MDKETKKEIDRLLNDAKGFLIVSNHGVGIQGSNIEIRAMLSLLCEKLLEGTHLTKEELIECVDNADADPIELLKRTLDELKEVLSDIKEEE